MTDKQKRNYILVGLVMCIIFGGVCFEKVQADSFFTWESTHIVADAVNDYEETMEESLCMGRVLKGCLDSGIVKADMEEQAKACLRVFLSFALVCSLPQVYIISYETVTGGLSQNNKIHAVIMQFIHTQDGEKE